MELDMAQGALCVFQKPDGLSPFTDCRGWEGDSLEGVTRGKSDSERTKGLNGFKADPGAVRGKHRAGPWLLAEEGNQNGHIFSRTD